MRESILNSQADNNNDSTSTVTPPDMDASTLTSVDIGGLRRTARRARRPGGLPVDLPLPKAVWALAMWPMLEQLMSSLVGFVDTTLAGHLPHEAVASTNGIGVASFATWLMGLLQGAVGVGATAIVARAIGARHRREANAAVGQAMMIALVWGLAIAVLFYFGAPLFGGLFGLSGRSHELCTQYLQLLAIAAPFMAMLFIGASCLRGAGDFRSPFVVMVVVNLVNVAVSVLLVAGPAPIGGHGLKGVAIGTMVAWFVGAGLMIGRLILGNGGVRLHHHRLGWQPRMLYRLIRIGGPSLIENGAMWIGHAIVLAIVGRMGNEDLIGAHHIAIRIEAFSFLPGFAFSLAAATMVGQYLGAGDVPMARRAAWTCWAYGAGIMTTLGVAFILVPRLFVWVVTDQQTFLDTVPPLLFVAGFAQIGFATSMVFAGSIRGAGDTRTSMALNLLSTWVVRLPLVWWVAMRTDWGLTGVWVVLSAEMMFRAAIFLARFLHGGWARVDV